MKANCTICGKEFERSRCNQTMCSDTCKSIRKQEKWKNSNNKRKKSTAQFCCVCGIAFEGGLFRKTCGNDECKKTSNKLKEKEYKQEHLSQRREQRKKRYYTDEAHRIRVIEYAKKRRAKDPEKMRQYYKNLYRKNRERVSHQAKERYAKNREQIIAKNRKWAEENADKVRIKNKQYYQANKQRFAAQNRKYRQEHPETWKTYQDAYRSRNLDFLRKCNREAWRLRAAAIRLGIPPLVLAAMKLADRVSTLEQQNDSPRPEGQHD